MLSCTFVLSLLFYSRDSSVVFVQVTQQVFMAEEWVRDAHNKANAEALSVMMLRSPWGPLNKNKRSCP